MDLFKTDPRRIASLILKGRCELGEVPKDRRAAVLRQVTLLKHEQLEMFLKSLKSMRVKELRDIAEQFPAIEDVSKLTKPWLIQEITKAQKE